MSSSSHRGAACDQTSRQRRTYKAVFMDVFIAWISNDRACASEMDQVRYRQTDELDSSGQRVRTNEGKLLDLDRLRKSSHA